VAKKKTKDMEYQLKDLIDIQLIQNLQDKLNEVFSFPSSMIDTEGNLLTATAWQDICTKFHRINPLSESECRKSGRYINDHLHEANPAIIYPCPHGMVDCATPIIIDGKHLGTFLTGQFFLKEPDIDFFIRHAEKYGFDKEKYLEAVSKVPVWSEERINQNLSVIKIITEILAEIGYRNLMEIEERKIIERNISELRQLELNLNRSENRFKDIVENSSDFIWEVDENGLYTYCSDKILDILGYPSDQVVGQKYFFDFLDPGIREESKVAAFSIFKRKESFRNYINHNVHKNGQTVILETSGSPMFDESGRFTGYRGADSDITQRMRAEEVLREQESTLRAITSSVKDAIIMIDDNGKISFWNDAAEDILGYSRDEVNGKNLHTLIAPKQFLEQHAKAFSVFRSTGNGAAIGKTLELSALRKDQKEISIELSLTSVRIREKWFAVGVLRDITERKRAEVEIRNLAKFPSENPNPELRLDRMGVILYGNNAAKPLLTDWGCATGEPAPEFWRDEVKTVLETKKIKTVEINCSGRTYSFIIVPITEEAYVNLYGRDITILKKAENALRESEEKYKTTFKTIPDAIVLAKIDGTIIDVNDSFSTQSGYQREEVIGASLHDMNIYAVPEERDRLIDALYKDGKVDKFETVFRCKDGSFNTELISASIINYNNEHHILSIVRDITDRKEIEKELVASKEKAEEASRLKSSLLLNMSHELRTPLNGILGFSRLLEESLTNPEYKEMAGIISISGKRLMSTLNSIMELAQVEADRTHVKIENMDIGSITAEILNLHKDLFENKGIQLVESIEKGICARLDKKLFGNILFHLIDNAAKYTDRGTVNLSVGKETRHTGSYAVIKVKDTGIGISGEKLGYIFEAFRQGDEGIGRSYEGTGLGLTLCKKFTTLMYGEIGVESKVGAGSTFILRFPLSEEIQVTDGEPSPDGEIIPRADAKDKPRVLIVEDNKANSDLMVIYLQNQFITDQVYNGIHAVKMAYLNNYDLILMDINLGQGMNGIESSREIRKIDHYLNIPMIAVTGYSTEKEKEQILSQGFDGFLSKPFDKKGLITIIKNTLEKAYND